MSEPATVTRDEAAAFHDAIDLPREWPLDPDGAPPPPLESIEVTRRMLAFQRCDDPAAPLEPAMTIDLIDEPEIDGYLGIDALSLNYYVRDWSNETLGDFIVAVYYETLNQWTLAWNFGGSSAAEDNVWELICEAYRRAVPESQLLDIRVEANTPWVPGFWARGIPRFGAFTDYLEHRARVHSHLPHLYEYELASVQLRIYWRIAILCGIVAIFIAFRLGLLVEPRWFALAGLCAMGSVAALHAGYRAGERMRRDPRWTLGALHAEILTKKRRRYREFVDAVARPERGPSTKDY